MTDQAPLTQIIHLIERMIVDTAEGKMVVFADKSVQQAVLRNMEAIGAISRTLSPAVTAAALPLWNRFGDGHPGWDDPEAVWAVIAEDLTALEAEVRRLLAGC